MNMAPVKIHIKIPVFWDVSPCSSVDRYPCFGGTCYFHLQGRRGFFYYTLSQKTENESPFTLKTAAGSCLKM
jgi:hypothetical protein